MKKLLYILFAFHIFLLASYSQTATLEWAKTYNNIVSANDVAADIKVDESGNVYVTGSNQTGTEAGNITTIKYTAGGDSVWVRTFNVGGGESVVGMVLDTNGNVYVTGYVGYNFGPYDIMLVKYNTNGDQQWIRYYDGGDNDIVNDIKIDKSNFIYLGGSTRISEGISATVILKYNTNGDTVWVRKTYLAGTYRRISSLAIDTAGNIYGGGTVTYTSPFETGDFLAVKYNSNGVQQWLTVHNSSGYVYDVGYQIDADGAGNSFMTGITEFNLSGNSLTVKFGQSGNVEWSRIYNSGFSNYGYFVKADVTGNNIYVSGSSMGNGTSLDYFTIKYNSVGDTLWTRRFNGTANSGDDAKDLIIDDSLNVYVTGTSTWNTTGQEATTIKYDRLGNQKWVARYIGSSNTSNNAFKIVLDNDGNFYVCGLIFDGVSSQSDYLTLKYSQLISVNPIITNSPENYKLFQNYPNPFNPTTKIKFDIPLSRGVSARLRNEQAGRGVLVKLIIYDILGREIAVLVNTNLNPGTYEAEFDGFDYPSGVYFYRLTAGEYTECKKMVLIK